jgi:hypothetical protein
MSLLAPGALPHADRRRGFKRAQQLLGRASFPLIGAPITSDCIGLSRSPCSLPCKPRLWQAPATPSNRQIPYRCPDIGLALNLRLNQYQSKMDAPHRVEHTEVMERHQEGGASERACVSVVDDDESVRESLPDLLKEFGFEACAFSSAQEFLPPPVA